MYFFSFGILFFTYYLNQIFNDSILGNISSASCSPNTPTNSSYTYCAVNALVSQHADVSVQPDPSLYLGDFINGLKIVFGLVTGDVINSAFHKLPFMDTGTLLLATAMFDFASALLFVYILANRSV